MVRSGSKSPSSTALRKGVWVMIDPQAAPPAANAVAYIGFSYTAGAGTIVGAGPAPASGAFIRRTAFTEGNLNDILFLEIDDPSKVYCEGSAAIDFVWLAI